MYFSLDAALLTGPPSRFEFFHLLMQENVKEQIQNTDDLYKGNAVAPPRTSVINRILKHIGSWVLGYRHQQNF